MICARAFGEPEMDAWMHSVWMHHRGAGREQKSSTQPGLFGRVELLNRH